MAAAVAAATVPAPSGSFSAVFWDLIFAATGLRAADIDGLRQSERDRSVCEETNRDYSWTEASVVNALRTDMQHYLTTLQQLKAENTTRATNKRPKSFVEEKKYQALRSREADQRITCGHIVQRMKELSLVQRGLLTLTSELCLFSNVQQLNLSRNRGLTTIEFLPPNLRVLFACGCSIEAITDAAMQSVPKLLFMSLSANRIEDLTFLAFTTSVAGVDLSNNEISSFDHLVDALAPHPSITEVVLLGNPVTLIPFFRERVASACKKLLRIDDKVVTADERNWKPGTPKQTVVPGTVPMRMQLFSVKGTSALQLPEEVQRVLSAGKSRGAAPAKDAKKAAKVEEEKKETARKTTTFSVAVHWKGLLETKTDPYDTVPVANAEETTGKDKKAAKDKKGAAVVSEQSNADEINLKFEATNDVHIERDTAACLARPVEIDLIVHDHVTGGPGGAEPRLSSFVLGKFFIDNSSLVSSGTGGGGTSLQENIPLTVNETSRTVMQRRVKKMAQHLADMHKEDKNLDALLKEAIRQNAPTPPADAPAGAAGSGGAHPPAPAAGKKPEPPAKGPAAKGPVAVKQVSEEVLKMQNESVARKVLIEELAAQLSFEEKRVNKLLGGSLSITVSTALGASAIAVTPAPTVTPVTASKK